MVLIQTLGFPAGSRAARARRRASAVLVALVALVSLGALSFATTAQAAPEPCELIEIPIEDLVFFEWRCTINVDAVFEDTQFGPQLIDGISSTIAAPNRPSDPEIIGHASEALWIDLDNIVNLSRGLLWVLFDNNFPPDPETFGKVMGPPLNDDGATIDAESHTATFDYSDDDYEASVSYQITKVFPDASLGFLLRQTYSITNRTGQNHELKVFNLNWFELNEGLENAWADDDGVITQISGNGNPGFQGIAVSKPWPIVAGPSAGGGNLGRFEFELFTRQQVSPLGTCGWYEYIPGVPCSEQNNVLAPTNPDGSLVLLNVLPIPPATEVRSWPADDPSKWQGGETGPFGGPIETAYGWEFSIADDETFTASVETHVYMPFWTVNPHPPGMEALPPHFHENLAVYTAALPEPSAALLQGLALACVTAIGRRRRRSGKAPQPLAAARR